MGRSMLAWAAVLAAALIAPAGAGAATGADAAATSAYIHADYALVSVGHANVGRTEADVNALLGKIRGECPRGAAGSPQDEQSTALSNELIGKMVLAGGTPDRAAVAKYLHAVAGLRWSSSSIDHAIGGYVKMLRTLYDLKSPDLCADLASWSAGGYTRLPAATAPFVAAFIPNWVSLGVLPKELSRFETPELKSIARRAARYESDLLEMEARLVETWGEIMNELVLNP